MASRVSSGIFFGCTAAQLETARASLVQKLIDFGPDRAVSLNVNSNSFAFAERGGVTIDRMMAELKNAFNQVDPDGWTETVLDRTAFGNNYGAQNGSAAV
jgi:hypothetical protein